MKGLNLSHSNINTTVKAHMKRNINANKLWNNFSEIKKGCLSNLLSRKVPLFVLLKFLGTIPNAYGRKSSVKTPCICSIDYKLYG